MEPIGSDRRKNGDEARLRSRQLAPAGSDLIITINGMCCRISAADGSVSRSELSVDALQCQDGAVSAGHMLWPRHVGPCRYS